MMRVIPPLALLLTTILWGCAVGYNATLFMTKSNIGLDVDTKPPTAEISIARREGVIAPAFEGGQTPPVVASFRSHSNPFSRFFFGVESTFGGGDAAEALAQGPGGAKVQPAPRICLTQKPDPQHFLWRDVSVAEKGAVEPFYFATDTTFGLKVAWSGTTGQFPDTLRLGFNRKEFAWAPLFGTDAMSCTVPGTTQVGKYSVWMPPFLAVLDNDVQAGTPTETGVTWLQYFATGTSATTLANLDQIRRVMLERIDPVAFESGTYDSDDPTVQCVEDWLDDNPDNPQKLQNWWSEKHLPGLAVLLIVTKEFKEQRQAFITEENIPCNQ
jgi:hypothetical protein